MQRTFKFTIAAVIAILIGGTAYVFLDNENSLVMTEPTGYITFSALEESTNRNYPHAFNVASGEFVSIQNDKETFYIETEPVENEYSYIQAAYLERSDDDPYYPYAGSPVLVSPNATLELDVINPGKLSKSPVGEIYTFEALSRVLTDSTDPSFYFASDNYQDSLNWSIYIADPINKQVFEHTRGHSPVWSKDGSYIFYLSVSGLNVFELASGMSWSIASLPERLPTPVSSLALSSNGDELFVLTTATAITPDRLFVYDVSDLSTQQLNNVDLKLKRIVDMPEGNHLDFVLSPDANHAVVTTYGDDYFELHLLNLQTTQISKELLFRWDGLEKYFHYPFVSWTNLSPTMFD